jgi:hypothetical protein
MQNLRETTKNSFETADTEVTDKERERENNHSKIVAPIAEYLEKLGSMPSQTKLPRQLA